MSYYIIKAKVENAIFETIFTDDQFNPIAFKYRNVKDLSITIPIMNYVSELNWLRNAINSSRNYYKPRRLTDEEYTELFNLLL